MPAQGYIVIQAFTSDAVIPVPDTVITVSQIRQDGQTELISVRETDRSGKTEPVVIETPELSESLTPGNGVPFAEVMITAEHPLYERAVVENAQVFADTVTLQRFQLIPLEKLPDKWDPTEFFKVPPQDL